MEGGIGKAASGLSELQTLQAGSRKGKGAYAPEGRWNLRAERIGLGAKHDGGVGDGEM